MPAAISSLAFGSPILIFYQALYWRGFTGNRSRDGGP